jgi:hypothetical protein
MFSAMMVVERRGGSCMALASPTASGRESISADEHVPGWTPPRLFRLKRVALAVASALASINIWTGGPLFALWIGSQFEGWVGARAPSTGVSMKSILVVVAVLAVVEIALIKVVTRVSDAYDKLTGRPHKARRASWLKSLGGERGRSESVSYGVSAVERIAIISVVLCVLAFELWWLLLPRSALPY